VVKVTWETLQLMISLSWIHVLQEVNHLCTNSYVGRSAINLWQNRVGMLGFFVVLLCCHI
jgi:hypothetical protein